MPNLNPFVGTWDTIFACPDGNPSVSVVLTVTESFSSGQNAKFVDNGKVIESRTILDGMIDGINSQPSVLHGTFDSANATWVGRWMNTPTSSDKQGDFTFTLGGSDKDIFTGKYKKSGPGASLVWNGRRKRNHAEIEEANLKPIPPVPSK